MALNKFSLTAFLLVAVLFGATASRPASAATANDGQSPPASERHLGDHIEGHIAFLKTELNITAAQEALWDKVATVMRADASEFEHLRPRSPTKAQAQLSALQHLEERVAYTALRAKSEQRFLDAFRPLYEKLSDPQKHSADELLGQGREAP